MANRATITYNGKTISTEDRDGSFNVTYNGSTIATVGAGQTKTLNCANQVMATNIVVGGKTLNCAKYKMATNVIVSVVSLFPSAPSSYSLIGTYTASQTWTAPEDGYFQIEVFGASGSGAESLTTSSTKYYYRYGGGGGGGGGYACSRIKMNKGDTVVLTVGAVGATTLAVINSSLESYATMQITSGANGTVPYKKTSISSVTYGFGGEGGVASGGNYANANGGKGGDGGKSSDKKTEAGVNPAPGGVGGVAGHADGNVGGHGATTREDGSAGFIKIYRGNTNAYDGPTFPVFYIQDLNGATHEYQFESGMDFQQFVNSSYNDGKFSIGTANIQFDVAPTTYADTLMFNSAAVLVAQFNSSDIVGTIGNLVSFQSGAESNTTIIENKTYYCATNW